jgi:hypothetical protein
LRTVLHVSEQITRDTVTARRNSSVVRQATVVRREASTMRRFWMRGLVVE